MIPWTIAATVHGIHGEIDIGTGRDPEAAEEQPERRIVRINGTPCPHAELSRHMAMIWLTPQMEQLFNEGTSAGRKFLDRLVYSFAPEHASIINSYDYAMRERNRLLQSGSFDRHWLGSLEQTMAEAAAAIAQARLETVDHINHAMEQSTLSFPKAVLAIDGPAEQGLLEGATALEVENRLKTMWEEGRRTDARAGRTLAGTHRSMLKAIHAITQLPAGSCSTGEQKAILLSIAIAQAHAGVLWKGILPVLLLDEIIAHLDTTKRLELFEEICQIGAQIWMTGTDPNLFAELTGKAQFIRVHEGHLSQA